MIGIYKIQNIKTEDFYIGSSVCIGKRWRVHKSRLNRNESHSPIIQNVWNKYGGDNFIFEVIEEFPLCEERTLRELEQYYINELNPKYNISRATTSHTYGTHLSKETKEKISISLTGRRNPEHSIRMSGEGNPMFGSNRGGKNSPRRKLTETNIFQIHILYNARNINGMTYKKLSEIFGTVDSNISDIINGNHWKDIYSIFNGGY